MKHSVFYKWISKYLVYLLMLLVLLQGLKIKKYADGGTIQNDVTQYYAFLPAAFLYHDLSFQFVDKLPEDFTGTIWTKTSPNGKQTLKMTMGIAFLNLPFFFLAHGSALIFKFPADGYSVPYHFFILIAAVFYLFLGLIILRNVLKQFFQEPVISISLLTIVLGTNLIYYTIAEPGMPHVYNFFLFAGLLSYSLKWYKNPSWQNSLILGLFAGLIILVRPSNIIVFIIPLSIGQWSSLKKRLRLFWDRRYKLLIIGIVMLILFFPQMLYWKFSTGLWIYYTYGSERFFLSHPQIINGLFSYRKGWLIYTPVMSFAIAGFIFLRKKVPDLFFPVLIYFIINLFVVFSWWCWWYGGSFGARPLIESYVLLSFPLAAFINQIRKKNYFARYFIIFILAGLIYVNLFQMRQYRISMIHWDSMSKELYWKVFLTNKWPDNYDQLLDHPDYDKALKEGRGNK